MPVIEIADLPKLMTPGKVLAGLDLGEKTIGLAVSDGMQSYAHPRPVILRKKFSIDANALIALLTRENVVAAVIGLPLNMDGSGSPRSQGARAMARNLEDLGLPILMWDERWTTQAAERAMIEQDFSRAKRAERIDSHAAALILQGAIDALAGSAF